MIARSVANTLALLFCATVASSNELPTTARGIYVATTPLVSTRALPTQAIFNSQAKTGMYLRLVWRQLEPKEGDYDFSLLDEALLRAKKADTRIALSIIAGARTPAWLEKKSESVSIQLKRGGKNSTCEVIRYVLPWGQIYQQDFGRLVGALSSHIREVNAWERLEIVKITGINRYSEELRLPGGKRDDDCGGQNTEAILINAGYSPSVIAKSWSFFFRTFATHFPDKVLAVEIIDRNDFPNAANGGNDTPLKHSLLDAAENALTDRFAIQWNGLSAHEELARVPLEYFRRGAILGWQSNAYNGFDGAGCNVKQRRRELCDPESYEKTLRRGVETGASYLEIWEDDLLRFEDVVGEMDRELRSRKN